MQWHNDFCILDLCLHEAHLVAHHPLAECLGIKVLSSTSSYPIVLVKTFKNRVHSLIKLV